MRLGCLGDEEQGLVKTEGYSKQMTFKRGPLTKWCKR